MVNPLSYAFLQNAFLGGSLVAIAAATLGYFLVLRGLTFAGHALSSIGFAGAAGAVLVGAPPMYGLLAFTVAGSLAISALGHEVRTQDMAVGVIMTFGLALGILFLSLYPGYAEQAYSILFGSIVGISRSDVIASAALSVSVLAALAGLSRPLLFSSLDPELAEARGVPVRLLATAFLFIVAVTVSVSVQIVGVLLLFALLVGPAATAARLFLEPWHAIGLAVLLALAYTWAGILLAVITPWPVSFFIASLSFGVYLPVRVFVHPGRARRRPSEDSHA